MSKKISIKLKNIEYLGDSIGHNIRLEISIKNKVYNLNKSIKPNGLKEINEEIAQFETLKNIFEEKISIKVVEKDLIFNDIGQINDQIKIDLGSEKSKDFKFKIKVQEMRKNLRKVTAIFNVILVIEQAKKIPSVDDPEWTGDLNDDTEQMILARMILGEAENQKEEAKIGVGFSVLNRVKKNKKSWGNNIHAVILKKSQYDSFWNKDTKDKVRDPFYKNVSVLIWTQCYEVAGVVLRWEISDPTFGATHFHSYKKQKDFPWWATKKNFKVKIDEMYFYELKA